MSATGILGIDPGKTGGFVLLSPEGSVLIKEIMPVTKEGELDLDGLARLFYRLSLVTELAVIEKVHGTVMRHGQGQSISAMFNFGTTYGTLIGMLAAFRIPFDRVTPLKWTSAMLGPRRQDQTTKDRARQACAQLFPGVSLLATPRSRVPHEGLVDALLIAEYGRKTVGVRLDMERRRA